MHAAQAEPVKKQQKRPESSSSESSVDDKDDMEKNPEVWSVFNKTYKIGRITKESPMYAEQDEEWIDDAEEWPKVEYGERIDRK